MSAYAEAYNAQIEGRNLLNLWQEGEAVNVMFSPVKSGERAVERLLQWVEEEDEQILLMVFSLRDLTGPGHEDSLVDILARKHAEGIPVAVITDASNWTKAALGSHNKVARNVESQLFIESADLDDNRTGLRYMGQWLKVLDGYGWQSVEKDGEMEPADLVSELTAHADWPTVTVRFTAIAQTEMGEEIITLGDIPALGSWGESGEGVPLSTTAETYPTWESDPVQLPLGVPIQWKLVARSDAAVRWEGGENRQSSPSLPLCGDTILHAEWR